MHTWWCQDVAAGAAHIDAGCDLAGAVAHVRVGHPEIEMPPAPGDHLHRGRQYAVLSFKLAQLAFGVAPVNIYDEDPGRRAGGDRHVVGGVHVPPTPHPA